MSNGHEAKLYRDHVAELIRRYDSILEQAGLDTVVIAAGNPHGVFLDDQHLPFKPNPHLLQWGPLMEHPGSVFIYTAGIMPEWLIYTPVDYWHSIPSVPELISNGLFTVSSAATLSVITKRISGLSGRVALVGEILNSEDSLGVSNTNPPELIKLLNEKRTVKTAWEVDNIRRASRIAIDGHRAAELCFNSGGSEYDIHRAFRAACRVTDNEMPYPAIVALNEHGATLHYQRLDRESSVNLSLLIDAGHAINGYASDITRSYSDDPAFGSLVEAMHELQRALCEAALPGVNYRELHRATHLGIANLLREADVLDMEPEHAVSSGVSRLFFPHGLGHFLGLQVHDVGALYKRRKAGEEVQDGEDPYLRLTRDLVPGNVLTIEPGVYFIDSLLHELRSKPEASMVNWDQIEHMKRFGGIRIEDNLHITDHGNTNLTRSAFAEAVAVAG